MERLRGSASTVGCKPHYPNPSGAVPWEFPDFSRVEEVKQRLLIVEGMNPRVVMNVGGWSSYPAVEPTCSNRLKTSWTMRSKMAQCL